MLDDITSTDEDTLDARVETRGRKPLDDAPRSRKNVIVTDNEWEQLCLADPLGKRNPQRGLRHLIAQRVNAIATQKP
jgi:hypothetical protein